MSRSSTRSFNPLRTLAHPKVQIGVATAISLFAGLSVASADTTWTTGSTITLDSTYVVSGVLTIEPGVTVEMGYYAAFVVGPDGTLLVNGTEQDPVFFTPQTGKWPGMRFEPGSEGELIGAIIEHSRQYGIEIIGSSPLIQGSTIRQTGWDTIDPDVSVAAIRASGAGAHPIIVDSTIDGVVGRRGATGSFGASGDWGESGANGGVVFQNGEDGEDGTDGFGGWTGGPGAPAYGILIEEGAQATVAYTTIRNVKGGKGGTGGEGGRGGNGGSGGDGWSGVTTGGNGGNGGLPGSGGYGGYGGIGGPATAIGINAATDQIHIFQNLIYGIEAGAGGKGGRKGSGGTGGSGGDGGDCSGLTCIAGHGGNGSDGGDANNSLTAGGPGGHTLPLTASNSTGTVTFVNNTVAGNTSGLPGDAGDGGVGGSGGSGGSGGTAGAFGTDGADGNDGASGSDSGVGSPGFYSGYQIGVRAQGTGTQIELFNNIIAIDGGPLMLSSQYGAVITADYNNFSGYTTLFTGSAVIGANNTEGDPLLADPQGGDMRLTSIDSPAIDAGSDNLLPPDIFDLNGNGDTTEPIPFDFDGNARVSDSNADGTAAVDIGAYEGVSTQVSIFREGAGLWQAAAPSEAYAFDEFFPGIANGGGCLVGDPTQPAIIELGGGTLTVSSFQGDQPVCAIITAASTPAVSDASLNNTNDDGVVVFEFDPPVTGFYTYFGSLASGHTATMDLFTEDDSALTLVQSITTLQSENSVAGSGMGFRSGVPIRRVEFTTSEPGQVLIGAFIGLLGGEPSLGTIELDGYEGPNGPIVELDFACTFAGVNACPTDVTGDGEINLADLNLVLANFGQQTSDGDTNGDGGVDLADLNAILAAFGTNCG